MKIQAIIFICLLISCQKPMPVSQTPSEKPISKNKAEAIETKEKFLKTDTVSVYNDGEPSKENYILAHLLDQKIDKDSMMTAKYRLDFYLNKTKTADSKITIKGVQKGSEWSAIYGLGRESVKNSPFFQISFGYPACGYMQDNYLYYLKNSDLQLVYEWDTMSDSGWGTWVEFESPAKTETGPFYCKTVSFEPDDNDENLGTVTHSDSIVFSLIGNQWKKQLLSAKEKPYFQKKMSFDDFHKQE